MRAKRDIYKYFEVKLALQVNYFIIFYIIMLKICTLVTLMCKLIIASGDMPVVRQVDSQGGD